MSHLKSFDFYTPVLSTDIVKPPETIPNDSPVPNPQVSQQKKKKKNKNKNKAKKQNSGQNNNNNNTNINNKDKIKVLETQEDIDAWIAERKKRFPTRLRVAEKERENQEREERGALDLSEQANKAKRKESKMKLGKNGKNDKPLEMSTFQPTKVPSILDKITQDEERRKHSIVLQCFRYFVKHNFLQEDLIIPNNNDNGTNSETNNKSDDSEYYSEYEEDSEE
ncbi:hypothetical protein TRFO_07629 [Tritrichomonas foetus]|uniref:FMR1-interacting protein 1 conserved domain-containing protein n=1 Tax=Tritrichomonas foetus TaxID=1144522 RepID=A0A1J4JSH5_9EUKA|nr:hypothetical protein TRFO_07629 [Tritrichomonas foetus]|eukprot:OHT01376.1 hypothetical protein TRFO_07629 [Tritrichomonas foetus]